MRKNSTTNANTITIQATASNAGSVFLEVGKAGHQQTSTIPYGDGRIRTDDPLLAKQVLSH
jgi:hypothetical protein